MEDCVLAGREVAATIEAALGARGQGKGGALS
jgi:hypothetical protein